jgi:hypothetical protein
LIVKCWQISARVEGRTKGLDADVFNGRLTGKETNNSVLINFYANHAEPLFDCARGHGEANVALPTTTAFAAKKSPRMNPLSISGCAF